MLLRYSIAMYGVNRSLIIVKRFLDWIHSWDSDRHKLEDVRMDPTAYLISQEYDVLNEQREILESAHRAIFEEELFAWYTDEKLWPAQRDLQTFLEWFDVSFIPSSSISPATFPWNILSTSSTIKRDQMKQTFTRTVTNSPDITQPFLAATIFASCILLIFSAIPLETLRRHH